ncbi:MAG: hypothetical protein HFG24_05930 [Anaerotruncus sp.]|uniref:hypothetical protein n=1 Tax=Anaerotruncus sp. G3(2012) TaxID=1235835 RepID=UPI0012DFE253|nr:hypothetical protein [Anaerotruncus sp. G3(2012)]MCI9159611.1 hypothetical protein [Anaerotruncus sp.]MCI9235502.1 hypothetical protein [Anaerotruncus sp.]
MQDFLHSPAMVCTSGQKISQTSAYGQEKAYFQMKRYSPADARAIPPFSVSMYSCVFSTGLSEGFIGAI